MSVGLYATENVSVHHKTLISIKDQFDLHKLWSYLEQTFFSKKIIWCFLYPVNIFYYLKHSLLQPSGSCLLANCHLHNIA